MHIFDYSFLRNLAVSPSMATRLAKIESMRTGAAGFAEENPLTAGEMTKLSIIMSTRESNGIEGISTEDSRIFRLLSGQVKPKGHDEYELLGYRDALSGIHSGHSAMEIDEATILDLFTTMVSHIDAEPGYRPRNNEVVDRDASGRIVKRYRTVPASEVPDCMFQLIGAFTEARNDYSIPGLLLIPCFILDFLKINPFTEGNGRMSRLLTVLLLYQEGFDVCSYVSVEGIINQSKADYYNTLGQSGEGWFDNLNDYLPFIDYMIGAVYLAYREMDRRMAVCIGRENKERRIERLLRNVSLPISKSEICALMPDVSEAYVELVIRRLLDEGRIRRIGERKSSRYVPADRVRYPAAHHLGLSSPTYAHA